MRKSHFIEDTKIEYLQVAIEPVEFTNDKMLEVKAQVNGVGFKFSKSLTLKNDFESLFDQLMDSAKVVIKELVKEHG